MFILKRQDVEITSVQHPKKDQKIPILNYQGQTFRLISVFSASQEEDAKTFWRDLTDNQGKACVLLEEPERFSVWGKIRVEQLASEADAGSRTVSPAHIRGALLMLQGVYIDIEDLLGGRQAGLFRKDISDVFNQWHFPQADSAEAVEYLLTVDPIEAAQIPPWQEHHLNTLLQELHRLGKEYFGNTSFVDRSIDMLQDMEDSDRKSFQSWMNSTPLGKLWK